MSSKHLNSVIRLIKLKGNDDYSLIINTESVATDDPDDTIITETLDPIHSFEGKYKRNDIDGTNIVQGDIKLYVDPSTLSAVPNKTDKITDGTTEYTIMNIERFKDIDTVALYIFQLRR